MVGSQSAGAETIAYEGFSPTFPVFNTGTGFSGPWAKGGFNALAAGYTTQDPSLLYVTGQGNAGNEGTSQNGGYGNAGLSSSGGSVRGGAFASINGAVRSLSKTLGADYSTVYVSFLVQPQGTVGDGTFDGFFGLTLNGSLGNELFIGKPGGGATTEYAMENRGGAGQVASGVPTVAGRTALLVVKAQFLPGADMFTLYVNPRPGSTEPTAGVVKSDLDLGTVSALGIYSTGAFTIDEIRVGTSFSDVTPAAVPSGK